MFFIGSHLNRTAIKFYSDKSRSARLKNILCVTVSDRSHYLRTYRFFLTETEGLVGHYLLQANPIHPNLDLLHGSCLTK